MWEVSEQAPALTSLPDVDGVNSSRETVTTESASSNPTPLPAAQGEVLPPCIEPEPLATPVDDEVTPTARELAKRNIDYGASLAFWKK